MAQRERQQAADDDSARKPHVKMVQLGRLVRGIERRDQRIAGRLHRPVGNAKEQGARVKAPVVPGENRQENAGEVAGKCEAEDPAEAEDIAQRSAEHHGECESPEGGSVDPAHLLVGQVEGGGPGARRLAPERKTHRSDHQRDAAGGEKTGRIGCHGGQNLRDLR